MFDNQYGVHGRSDATTTASAASTAYTVGAIRLKSDQLYKCVTAGTSGSSGPSGTGTGIPDGTCYRDYYASIEEPMISVSSSNYTTVASPS